MNIFRARVWSVVDIGLLKWSCILTGMIAGAYLSEFTKRFVWFFGVTAVLLAIKPALSYFRTGAEHTDSEPSGPRYQIEKPKVRR